MATNIVQHPLYNSIVVGQDIIYSVENPNIVANFTGVKIIAKVFISNLLPVNTGLDIPIGTFKTTPNNAGVGMFNLKPIIESFVSADNMARDISKYKNTLNANLALPIHLIDAYSGNNNIIRYAAVVFTTEYIDANGDIVSDGTSDTSEQLYAFNGYLKYTDVLDLNGDNFGYNNTKFILGSSNRRFLTNAPATQYANLEDYGTIGIFDPIGVNFIKIKYFDTAGVPFAVDNISKSTANGAYDVFVSLNQFNVLYFGIFPGNLRGNINSSLQTLINNGTIQGGSYTVEAFGANNTAISKTYTINLNCPNTKGFEPIRLCWLNQWGAWDYYTFTMKSSKMISTKGSTYEQLEGTWNQETYRVNGFRGGKKSFRVNATEKITMNTDFVSENESVWFEELINSPEVYILEGFQTDANNPALNNYVIPVRLTTSSYTRKTVANDKIMQYTFEVEKSKTLRTQSI